MAAREWTRSPHAFIQAGFVESHRIAPHSDRVASIVCRWPARQHAAKCRSAAKQKRSPTPTELSGRTRSGTDEFVWPTRPLRRGVALSATATVSFDGVAEQAPGGDKRSTSDSPGSHPTTEATTALTCSSNNRPNREGASLDRAENPFRSGRG